MYAVENIINNQKLFGEKTRRGAYIHMYVRTCM